MGEVVKFIQMRQWRVLYTTTPQKRCETMGRCKFEREENPKRERREKINYEKVRNGKSHLSKQLKYMHFPFSKKKRKEKMMGVGPTQTKPVKANNGKRWL